MIEAALEDCLRLSESVKETSYHVSFPANNTYQLLFYKWNDLFISKLEHFLFLICYFDNFF